MGPQEIFEPSPGVIDPIEADYWDYDYDDEADMEDVGEDDPSALATWQKALIWVLCIVVTVVAVMFLWDTAKSVYSDITGGGSSNPLIDNVDPNGGGDPGDDGTATEPCHEFVVCPQLWPPSNSPSPTSGPTFTTPAPLPYQEPAPLPEDQLPSDAVVAGLAHQPPAPGTERYASPPKEYVIVTVGTSAFNIGQFFRCSIVPGAILRETGGSYRDQLLAEYEPGPRSGNPLETGNCPERSLVFVPIAWFASR